MPRLIVKGSKIGVLRGRLVTDAGGARCCCGPPGCQCNLSNPVALRRWGCTPLADVPLLGGALFGVVTIRVQWVGTLRYSDPQGNFQEMDASGSAVLCASDPNGPPVALAESGSTSSVRYRVSAAQGVRQASVVYGADRWGWAVNRVDANGTAIPIESVRWQGALMTLARQSSVGPTSLFRVDGIPQQGTACVQTIAQPGSGNVATFDFADSDAGGSTRGTFTHTPQFPNDGTYSASIDVTWTRDLSCRVGGSGILPPGINPQTLRPYSSGPCVGCGD